MKIIYICFNCKRLLNKLVLWKGIKQILKRKLYVTLGTSATLIMVSQIISPTKVKHILESIANILEMIRGITTRNRTATPLFWYEEPSNFDYIIVVVFWQTACAYKSWHTMNHHNNNAVVDFENVATENTMLIRESYVIRQTHIHDENWSSCFTSALMFN